jgi:hypothetical protein
MAHGRGYATHSSAPPDSTHTPSKAVDSPAKDDLSRVVADTPALPRCRTGHKDQPCPSAMMHCCTTPGDRMTGLGAHPITWKQPCVSVRAGEGQLLLLLPLVVGG